MAENYIEQYYSWVTGNTLTAARLNGNVTNLITGLSTGAKTVNIGKLMIASTEVINASREITATKLTVDNVVINGNIVSSSSGDLTLTSPASLNIQMDTDNNGTEYVNFKNGEGVTVVQLTEAGYVIASGYAQLTGGITVNSTMFTVDGANGNTVVAGTLTVQGAYFYVSPNFRFSENATDLILEQNIASVWTEANRFTAYGG